MLEIVAAFDTQEYVNVFCYRKYCALFFELSRLLEVEVVVVVIHERLQFHSISK